MVVVVLVKFYWGQNEDRRLGDGPSDGSEKLLQRGDGQCRCDSGEAGVHANISLCKEFSVSHQELMSSPHDEL